MPIIITPLGDDTCKITCTTCQRAWSPLLDWQPMGHRCVDYPETGKSTWWYPSPSGTAADFDYAAFNARMKEHEQEKAAARQGTTSKPRTTPTKGPHCIHYGAELEGDVYPPKDGLGDKVETALTAIGITKDRWAAAVATVTGQMQEEGGCTGCGWRQKIANRAGRLLGIGKESERVAQLLALEEGQRLPVHACALHGRCLARPLPAGLEGAPRSCVGCSDRVKPGAAGPPQVLPPSR
jgi:hypothetical protein